VATAYDFVSTNKRRSIFLIGGFVVIIGALGYVIQYLYDIGPIGTIAAVGFSAMMSMVAYYSGDQIALRASGAQGPITKQTNPYLWNMVENLCIATGLPMPKLYVIPEQTINAFATGRDPEHASIAVTSGAIERLENEELQGVLAHELSHVKNFDIRFMMLVTVLVGAISLLANTSLHSGGFRRRNSDSNQGGGIIAIFGILLVILAPIAAQLIRLSVSRKREFLADASGALMTRYPAGLANALAKIEADGQPMQQANSATAPLFFSSPFGKKSISSYFSTHPPVADRIAALRKMGA